MEWVWSDGGRAGSGFVGLTGDCVVRAIAIATGLAYKEVYKELGDAMSHSPRQGVSTATSHDFLSVRGWDYAQQIGQRFTAECLPMGTVIVHLINDTTSYRTKGHYSTVVDHVVYDTWNPGDEDAWKVVGYWTCVDAPAPGIPGKGPAAQDGEDSESVLTQKEFDRIMHRLRSLENTANNHASTEGEKRNALRMMQNLLLRHNLDREDIREDDNTQQMRFTRIACPVNGRRACTWEKWLAHYLTKEIFPLVSYYIDTCGHRTLFYYYGPRDDVMNARALFREMLVTIAAAAHLKYRGYSRGSGASYCEAYVANLPKSETSAEAPLNSNSLIHSRTLAVRQAAKQWLKLECGVELVKSAGNRRSNYDPVAAATGKRDGQNHDMSGARGQKRIGHRK